MSDPRPSRESSRRLLKVLAALILTASVSGFFMGLKSNRSKLSLTRPVEAQTADSQRRASIATGGKVVPASAYSQVDRRLDGPNSQWRNRLSQFIPATAPVTEASESDLAADAARRSQRRAFDGAPPVIPHPIQQDSTAACLACHAQGLQIKDRQASKISHPHFANCTQCHAPGVAPGVTNDPRLLAPLASNVFMGAEPMAGGRAFVGAPPTIPHPTTMRSDCLSCHGSAGTHRLRTPHPERQSCVQCHVPGASTDPRP